MKTVPSSVQVSGREIQWSEDLMESLRTAVMERFESASPVGAEIAGLLYGRRTATGIRLLAWRTIPAEMASQPALPATPDEEAEYRSLIEDHMQDLELRVLEPIGWFRSRTRGMGALSPEDAAICRRLFGETEVLAVILRPSTQRPVGAAFFFVQPGESGEASRRGVEIRLTAPEPDAELASAAAESPVAAGAESTPSAETIVGLEEIATPEIATEPIRPRPRWPAVAAFAAGVVATAGYCLLAIDRPVELSARLSGERLGLSWNRSAGFLTGATGAELIVNGRSYELSLENVREGLASVTSPQKDAVAPHAKVTLRIRGPLADGQSESLALVW